ncbi:transposase [Virgibacillus halodenitrificans]|uniref:Transposase n=1 Tax=Virgibacillus halodenitrificans TaxID=1482 RepID=A0AAC9J204_VIRHA|nr:LXG domain-containing protein [Virgibacillus halodenitrificans]APC49410.1 transposase [Virgibacillus halodenitrificans]MCJ0929956.1 LXG domain-containing protein [Virgibacillus halodenitrificans]
MKAIKISEVKDGLNQLIQNKETEKEQILALRDAINSFINLDSALEGEGGDAIRDHFVTLHLNAVILFNLFLEEYISALKEIKNSVDAFENNDAFIQTEFIETTVKTKLNQLEDMSSTLIESINNEYNLVSDIAGAGSVSSYFFNQEIANAREKCDSTVNKLGTLDEVNTASLENSEESINEVAKFTSKIKTWTNSGVFLTDKQLKEIETYYSESDMIEKMIENATKLSIEQGDSTIQGEVANWIGSMGNASKAYGVAKGAIAFQIMNSNMLEMTKDGKGNFVVTASSKWKKVNGKYGSKLAENIHKLLKQGDPASANPLRKYLSKYNNAPSGVLKQLIGMKPGTTKLSFGKVANNYSNVLVLDKNSLKDYSMKVDWKKTAEQVTDASKAKNLLKRVPYVGMALSVGFNSTEYYSDTNKNKSFAEKSGRFIAGLGVDAGIAGLTTGGAAIGTMICPGVGTVIGGAIGAGVGIIGSIAFEDKIKDIGENTADWLEERTNDLSKLKDNVKDGIKDLSDKASGLLSSIFN